MAPAARAALESLLRTRKLDTTLTTALPAAGGCEDAVSTGVTALDAHLFGGLPRGQLSEIAGPRSSGRTSLMRSILAEATARGDRVALIDTLDRWDPPGLAERGVDLTRLLWVRGRDVSLSPLTLAAQWDSAQPSSGQRRRSQIAQALDRAIKAVMLVVHTRTFGLVALDLADVPIRVVRELPFTTWMRLQRVLDGSSTACVLLGAEPVARSAGGLSIRLHPPQSDRQVEWHAPISFQARVQASRRPFVGRGRDRAPAGRWSEHSSAGRRFCGLDAQAAVIRAHRAVQTTERVALSFRR